jgi:pyruvate kinase
LLALLLLLLLLLWSLQICASAALMANKLEASAIFVFTRRGYMAHFLSRCRCVAVVQVLQRQQQQQQQQQ